MHWLYNNVNHLTVPLGILLALFAVIVGLINQRNRQRSKPRTRMSAAGTLIAFVVILICVFILGLAVAHNLG